LPAARDAANADEALINNTAPINILAFMTISI